jgi:hypothetical protein
MSEFETVILRGGLEWKTLGLGAQGFLFVSCYLSLAPDWTIRRTRDHGLMRLPPAACLDKAGRDIERTEFAGDVSA